MERMNKRNNIITSHIYNPLNNATFKAIPNYSHSLTIVWSAYIALKYKIPRYNWQKDP